MMLEIPEWIIEDIDLNGFIPQDAWIDDVTVNRDAESFKKLVISEIETAYRNKDLFIGIQNFMHEWNNKINPTTDFEIIFKGEQNGR